MTAFLHFLQMMVYGFAAGVVVACFFEWALHKFFMHKVFLGIEYGFRTHALVHHDTFKSDHRYHLVNEPDKETIPMAWWNGPLMILGLMVPTSVIAWRIGSAGIAIGALIAYIGYYAAYEYMHWCMHLPKKRRIEKSWIFYRLNGHHLLHHRYMHKNFNVVLPLADLLLGTLRLRSKIKFAQPIHEAVPDVQPLTPKHDARSAFTEL